MLLAGCVAPIPFDTVTLGGEPTVRTGMPARLELAVGPATSKVNVVAFYQGRDLPPEMTNFGAEQQREFADLLGKELLRLRVFDALTMPGRGGGADAGSAPIELRLEFVRTRYEPHHHNYLLDVRLSWKGPGGAESQAYVINANEEAGWWELANSNIYDAQIRAVRKLLAAIVADVRAWATKVAGPAGA